MVPIIVEYIRVKTFSKDHDYSLDEFIKFYQCEEPAECYQMVNIQNIATKRCNRCIEWAGLAPTVLYPNLSTEDFLTSEMDAMFRSRSDGYIQQSDSAGYYDDNGDAIFVLLTLQELQLSKDTAIFEERCDTWLPAIFPTISKVSYCLNP